MNMNIVPAAVTSAKPAADSNKTASVTDSSAQTDTESSAAPGDFATQLEAQLGAKTSAPTGQLAKQLSCKDPAVDNNTLAQAINAGAKAGTLSLLDQTQLKQVMTAVQSLPDSSLKTADLNVLKNLIAGGKDDARDGKSEDASALPVQALFAMLAAQPAQQPVAAAAAQSATLTQTDGSKEKSALLQSLSGDAKSLLSVEDKAADHKTAVTDSTPAASSKNSKASDFNSALAAMTAAVSTAVQPESQQKSADSSLLQTLNQVNSAAIAAPATTVSSTPTTTSLLTAPGVPQLNAQLGSPEWQQQLGQQVMMFNRQGQQTAELRLHPQDLGSIQISMKIEDGQAQMHFVSGHSGVRAALEAAMPQLRTSLADSGINLTQSNVASDTSQWQQPGSQQSGQQSGSSQGNAASWAAFNGASAVSTSDALPVPASLQQLANGKSGVDIFA